MAITAVDAPRPAYSSPSDGVLQPSWMGELRCARSACLPLLPLLPWWPRASPDSRASACGCSSSMTVMSLGTGTLLRSRASRIRAELHHAQAPGVLDHSCALP